MIPTENALKQAMAKIDAMTDEELDEAIKQAEKSDISQAFRDFYEFGEYLQNSNFGL